MKKNKILSHILSLALLLLWIPTTLDKLIHFTSFQEAMLRQPISNGLAPIVSYLLPTVGLIISMLLLNDRYRKYGFALSSISLLVLTAYVGLALVGIWGKLPCGCGTIIDGISWVQQLWINLFFLLISLIGYGIAIKRKDIKSPDNQRPLPMEHFDE